MFVVSSASRNGVWYPRPTLRGGRQYPRPTLRGGRQYPRPTLRGGRQYPRPTLRGGRLSRSEGCMLPIDLHGKRALVAGIADDRGFGFAIAKSLAEAGASVCAATWPPAYFSFTTMLRRGKLRASSALSNGSELAFERIYALDAQHDRRQDVPEAVLQDRRYRDLPRFTIQELAQSLEDDFGASALDVVVHCVANGPELTKPLLETSRQGYLAALSASSYSFVSLVQRLAPLMREGGSFLCMSFIAATRVIPGYGGGMSSAKAALESDTRVLAFEAGRRYGLRVNCISAGPWASRAASATGFIDLMIDHVAKHSPIPKPIAANDVGSLAAFLASPLAQAITASTIYVDHGSHSMGIGFSA
jgi:enoyl-[acyl-carrier protein] reductase I